MKKTKMILVCIVSYILLAGCVTSIDNRLPYEQLPEITVATQFNLVASPSHPTAYLSSKPIPAGTKVQVLGEDKNAAWLLILYNNQLGWMPTFYSQTNVGALKPAIVVEPLSDKCSKYLGATTELDKAWASTISGSAFVVGSIYRSQVAAPFTDAALTLEIEGSGATIASDYVHTPLTSSSAVVLFGFSVAGLQKNSQLHFILENSSKEPLSFQAAFFSNDCSSNLNRLAIGSTKNITQTSPTLINNDNSNITTTKEIPIITHNSYIWSVRAYNIDDAAAVLVNGKMVVGGTYTDSPGDTGWVDITKYIIPGQANKITLASLDGIKPGAWGFLIRRGDTIVWGQEGDTNEEFTVEYSKTLTIDTSGEVAEAVHSPAPASSPSGTWTVHIQDTDDLGLVLVNGQPVGGSFFCNGCQPGEQPRAATIDITPWLDASRPNEVSMAVWNNGGPFSYQLTLEQNESKIWQHEGRGEGDPGVVFSDTIAITPGGKLKLAPSNQSTATTTANPAQLLKTWTSDTPCPIQPVERCILSDTFDSSAVGKLTQLSNGDSWAKFEVADPTLIFYEGKFHLWFTGRASKDDNFYSIGYASSVDGNNWEVEPSPVLSGEQAGSWEEHGVAGPNVIIENGQFIMFYQGFQGDQWIARIGIATSKDGIHWEKSEDNPIFKPDSETKWMSNSVRDPSVLVHDGIYSMWFSGSDGTNWQLGYAESKDGHNWIVPTKKPVLSLGSSSSWKADGILAPDVLLVGNTFHMWYSGWNEQNNIWRIGDATSTDGLTWTENLNNPTFGLGPADGFANGGVAHPVVLASREGYHLWYAGSQAGTSGEQQIGYAASKNGEKWLR